VRDVVERVPSQWLGDADKSELVNGLLRRQRRIAELLQL
jgi:hypothetical protein